MKWGLVLVGSLGLGVVVAAAISAKRPPNPPPAPIVPVLPIKSPGEELADAYDNLFSDLTLVKQGVLGLSRVPFDPVEAHKIPSPDRPSADPFSRKIIAIRKELANEGLLVEEGVIGTDSRLNRKVYDPVEWIKAMNEGLHAEDRLATHSSPVALWQSKRNKKVGDDAHSDTLFTKQNRSSSLEDPALTKYANRVVALIKKDPKAISHETIKGWTLYARAVPFRSKECLSCHPGRKVGDPAAIVAFATRKQPTE